MLKSYIIIALFLLPTGEVSKIDQSENMKFFGPKNYVSKNCKC